MEISVFDIEIDRKPSTHIKTGQVETEKRWIEFDLFLAGSRSNETRNNNNLLHIGLDIVQNVQREGICKKKGRN